MLLDLVFKICHSFSRSKAIMIGDQVFKIRKISPAIDVFENSPGKKAARQVQIDNLYGRESDEHTVRNLVGHMTDVICAGIEFPKVSRHGSKDSINAEKMALECPTITAILYLEILKHTYGSDLVIKA